LSHHNVLGWKRNEGETRNWGSRYVMQHIQGLTLKNGCWLCNVDVKNGPLDYATRFDSDLIVSVLCLRVARFDNVVRLNPALRHE